MVQPPFSLSEVHLLKKEIEAQGDFLNQERLDRATEIDRLRMEMEAIKESLQELLPEFLELFENRYGELLQNFNPTQGTGT